MMRKLPFCALLISGMLFFVSCNNDENEPIANVNNAIPQAILDVFQSQYGNTRAEWSVRNGYAIAEFWGENGETTAWYSLNNGSAYIPSAIEALSASGVYDDEQDHHSNKVNVYGNNQSIIKDDEIERTGHNYLKHFYETNKVLEEVDELV